MTFLCGWRWIFAATFLSCACVSVSAQTFPTGFVRQLVTGSITKATSMAIAGDGRIFVTQQTGQLRIVKAGALLTAPFLELTVDDAGERGLLGIALDPMFPVNNFLYVYYTVPGTPAHNRISRFTANGDVAVPGSEQIILELDALGTKDIHNGGAMIFGTDGKLYVGVGENGLGSNAQNLSTYLGKILRINPDGSVPADNPNAGGSAYEARFWGIGVRNPFDFSLDPVTGKIYLIDVGANAFEEINDVTIGGRNYGWPSAEGISANPAYTNPVYTYPHATGDDGGCAITGGTFFSPVATNFPSAYYGKFFLMDFCEEWIHTIDPFNATTATPFASAVATRPLYLETGVDGNLYFLSRVASLYRIVYTDLSPPFIVTQPEEQFAVQGGEVSFSVHAIGSEPLTFQWYRNGVAISGATASAFTLAAAQGTDAGIYTVVVANGAGTVTSDPALLDVEVITATLRAGTDALPVLYPNPIKAGGSVNILLHAPATGQAIVAILDKSGTPVLRTTADLAAGANYIAIPVEELAAGFYLVAIEAGDLCHRQKLIIFN